MNGHAAPPDVLSAIVVHATTDGDHAAVKDPNRDLTFRELIDEVARAGEGLRLLGVQPNDRVAIVTTNSVDFVVASLATLWVGATFVPLAASDPLPRLRTIISNCAPALIVSTELPDRSSARDASKTLRVIPLSDLRVAGREPGAHEPSAVRPAYMIYTSGTTGTPKGVQISTAAFGHAIQETVNALGMDRDTRTLCVSPFHFDGSYANLFSALFSGGSAVIWPREALLFPRTFFRVVEREKVTFSGFTPSYLRLLLSSPQLAELESSSLTTIALGGESVTTADLSTLWSSVPTLRVFNRYGPTETTIAVTNEEMTPSMIEEGTVPIGRPHPGVSFYLLDETGTLIGSAGIVGELYVGGAQLMDGYFGDTAMTGEVLRTDVIPGETLYRTGDLVYRDEFGRYVYVDRADRVVKRGGVRISLLELNQTLCTVPHVTSATCIVYDDGGKLGIAAFVVVSEPVSVLDLRRGALQMIPETMLPNRFDIVEELPLNTSNKLDERKMLSDVGLSPLQAHTAGESIVH